MKWRILFSLIVLGGALLILEACKEQENEDPDHCLDEGIIIGPDYRKCVCCGGWFIEIGQDTLRAKILPREFTDELDANAFPLPVSLDWMADENPCLGDEIEVSCIKIKE